MNERAQPRAVSERPFRLGPCGPVVAVLRPMATTSGRLNDRFG
jgi:hypothetical protein